ncbi:MAG: Hsp33 family molecular chaperone HslO [Proteobacteria bacterium]|nr:Hsp33 family molecular chaperone HslO [Pseudomonadota bacterium]
MLITKSYYYPEREVLFLTVEMSNFLIDYYLHMKEFAPEMTASQDEKLKELIACFAVHLTLNPANENHAWTLHLISEKPYSLFVTGDTEKGTIVGHALSSDIRHTDVNMFHSQVIRKGDSYRSSIRAESDQPAKIVENYYRNSQQLPARFYVPKTSDTASTIVAMPGCDVEWFNAFNLETEFDKIVPNLKQMRNCSFKFYCGCSIDKLMPFFKSLAADELSDIYKDDEHLIITCPRCGKIFKLLREDIK